MTLVKRHPDLFVSLALLIVLALFAIFFVNFSYPPFEDAAMLMRYADHLAHGYGIVWNIGQHPVDGATDFLFMVSVAGLMKIGVPLARAVRGLGIFSVAALVLLIYWVNRRLWKAHIAFAALSALYLAFGVGLTYVAAYFGTPFFALFAALTWTLSLILIQKENPPLWLSLLFAFSGLITGLIRPEGVILASLMMISIIVMKGWRASAKTIGIFIGVFLILGGAYFLWRWNYFGYPLPNPFYKKGGGLLHWDGLQASFSNVIWLCGIFLLAYLIGFRSSKTVRQTIAFLIPVIGFASAFILISDETNIGGRFQYAVLPIVLLSWFPLVRGFDSEIGLTPLRLPQNSKYLGGEKEGGEKRTRRFTIATLSIIAILILGYSYGQDSSIPYSRDGRYDIALALQAYSKRGYTMATSEAGLLPLYSQWNAVDTWGLNDEWIAHNGGITADYLDRYKPELIIFHAHFSPFAPPTTPEHYPDPVWFEMTMTLKNYAESHHYILAAVFGVTPYDTHYYYVRPDFADSQTIVKLISKFNRYSWVTAQGIKAVNFANIPNP
jgi:arabinofuranosyltransferase